MAAMSDFLENKIVDFIFRGQALGITGGTAAAGTGPANLYVGLFTTNPTDTGGGVEVSGSGYTRVTIVSNATNWAATNAAASTVAPSTGNTGTTSNNGAITFGTPGANWGVITGFGIFDASTAGNLLIFGALTTSKTVNNGDAAPAFSPAALSIQIDN